jgi:metallo-beta-lactamase family protein
LRITFHGATRQVTGSAHLLEIGSHRILLDCGLFDSDRIDPDGPNRQMPFDPRSLDAVIVSHAHNDHIGRLPCLVRAGYAGPIFATPATADITNVMLRDSARIQREEVRNAHLKHPEIESPEPLFELHDVEWVIEHLKRVPYEQPTEVVPGVTLTYQNAGHILGSAIVQLDFREGARIGGLCSRGIWGDGILTCCTTRRLSATSIFWFPKALTGTASLTLTNA